MLLELVLLLEGLQEFLLGPGRPVQDLVIANHHLGHGASGQDHLLEVIDVGLEVLIDPWVLHFPGEFVMAHDLAHRRLEATLSRCPPPVDTARC